MRCFAGDVLSRWLRRAAPWRASDQQMFTALADNSPHLDMAALIAMRSDSYWFGTLPAFASLPNLSHVAQICPPEESNGADPFQENLSCPAQSSRRPRSSTTTRAIRRSVARSRGKLSYGCAAWLLGLPLPIVILAFLLARLRLVSLCEPAQSCAPWNGYLELSAINPAQLSGGVRLCWAMHTVRKSFTRSSAGTLCNSSNACDQSAARATRRAPLRTRRCARPLGAAYSAAAAATHSPRAASPGRTVAQRPRAAPRTFGRAALSASPRRLARRAESGRRNIFVIPSRREARLTTGPKTVTFTWSTVPILPATARPVARPMPDLKPGERIVGFAGRPRRIGGESPAPCRARAMRRRLRQRPAPEAHRRVAVKIADHASLLGCGASSTPSAWLTRFKQSQQIGGRLFAAAREATQIAKQHA